MNNLLFATGNKRKFDEARRIVAERLPGTTLRPLVMDLSEPQTSDSRKLLTEKVRQVREKTALPFIVDDTSCRLQGTDDFPGTAAKQVMRGLGSALPSVFTDGLAIIVRCDIAFSYLDEIHFFSGSVEGMIRHGDAPATDMPLDAMVYLPDQGRYLGDPRAETHRTRAMAALCDFLADTRRRDERDTLATAARWTSRAATWTADIADSRCYVNHEDGYDRFDTVLGRIMASTERPRCLDVGCGTGAVSRAMSAAGAVSVLGLDVSEGMVAQARQASPAEDSLSFSVGQIDTLAGTGPFDVIASRGVVLSHLPKHQLIDHLTAITQLSRPGSYAIFDFIQRLGNGPFTNVGQKHELGYAAVVRIMRELGWVPVARDGGDDARVVIAAFHRPFSDSLYFVSGNPQKLLELQHATDMPHLHGCDFDIPELKDDDIVHIAEEKARQAFAIVGRPVISTDGGIFFDAYDGFPGPNSKQAATKLKPEGLLRLLAGAGTRAGWRKNVVAWFDGKEMRTETQEVPLTVAEEARGEYPSYPMDRILVPTHTDNAAGLTYAEMPLAERTKFTELPRLAAFVAALR